MTFGAIVVGIIALILVNRSWRLPVWRTVQERHNRTMAWIVLVAGLVLVMLLVVPWLRDAFDLGAVTPGDGLVILLSGLAGVIWFEVYKALGRR